MLKDSQIKEIRKFLEESENPLFFFDDDQDGMSSYFLLKRKYKKGRGIPAKTRVGDDEFYIRKIEELKPDLVVFLDRPVVSQEVIDAAKNAKVIWIDHHQPVERFGVKYYNPMVLTKGDNRPTSYWCYKVVEQDMWIAMIGIVGDWHVPDFVKEFEYPELLGKGKTPPEILFDAPLGKLVKLVNFMTKGTSTEAKKYLSVFEKIESPYEILNQETARGKFLWKKYEKLNKEYEELLKKALKAETEDKLFVFIYPTGNASFTGGLSNELLYRLDKDAFIIARETEEEYRLSIRGKTVDVLPMLQNVLKTVEGHGGGHMRACGAGIKKEDFTTFIEGMKAELAKVNG